MDMVSLLISLISGAAGGNVAGALLKNLSLGTTGNSIVGIIGGVLASYLLPSLGLASPTAAGGLDLGTIVAQVAGGGVGGGALMAILGAVRSAMAAKA